MEKHSDNKNKNKNRIEQVQLWYVVEHGTERKVTR